MRRTQRQLSLKRFLDLIPVSLFRGNICLFKSPLSKILFLQLLLVHLHLLITVATNAIAHTIGDNSPAIYTCKINSNHHHITLPNVQWFSKTNLPLVPLEAAAWALPAAAGMPVLQLLVLLQVLLQQVCSVHESFFKRVMLLQQFFHCLVLSLYE